MVTVSAGARYLPYARARIKALRYAGFTHVTQTYQLQGFRIAVRIADGDEWITITQSGNLYLVFWLPLQDSYTSVGITTMMAANPGGLQRFMPDVSLYWPGTYYIVATTAPECRTWRVVKKITDVKREFDGYPFVREATNYVLKQMVRGRPVMRRHHELTTPSLWSGERVISVGSEPLISGTRRLVSQPGSSWTYSNWLNDEVTFWGSWGLVVSPITDGSLGSYEASWARAKASAKGAQLDRIPWPPAQVGGNLSTWGFFAGPQDRHDLDFGYRRVFVDYLGSGDISGNPVVLACTDERFFADGGVSGWDLIVGHIKDDDRNRDIPYDVFGDGGIAAEGGFDSAARLYHCFYDDWIVTVRGAHHLDPTPGAFSVTTFHLGSDASTVVEKRTLPDLIPPGALLIGALRDEFPNTPKGALP